MANDKKAEQIAKVSVQLMKVWKKAAAQSTKLRCAAKKGASIYETVKTCSTDVYSLQGSLSEFNLLLGKLDKLAGRRATSAEKSAGHLGDLASEALMRLVEISAKNWEKLKGYEKKLKTVRH
jgi:hypothetical protein